MENPYPRVIWRCHSTLSGCIFAIALVALSLWPHYSHADTKKDPFDFMLAITQQDAGMDWWFAVPAQFGPVVSHTEEVTRGEGFKILPIFNNYGTGSDKKVDVTYDVEIVKPDGTIDESQKNITGYKGSANGPYLLPARDILIVSFDPEDPLGEYTVKVSAYDHIKKENADKSQKIILKDFGKIQMEGSLEEWFLSYPTRPKPSSALSRFVNSPRPHLDEKGQVLWSALWLYKIIYGENEFLIPHTVEFYESEATQKQKKDIILLFHLLKKTDELPIGKELQKYLTDVTRIAVLDPYEKIETADQLDMLWAEYFATSRRKPIRQIITALNLSTHIGTLEKIKSGELGKSDDVLKKAMLEAVFQSAIWSIMSNCKQSPLLFQYCIGLYESGELNDTEKGYLGGILQNVSEEKQTDTSGQN